MVLSFVITYLTKFTKALHLSAFSKVYAQNDDSWELSHLLCPDLISIPLLALYQVKRSVNKPGDDEDDLQVTLPLNYI